MNNPDLKALKRFDEAVAIDDGACNPVPVARALVDAIQAVRDDARGTDAILDDPACMLIVHQLAHLFHCHPDVPLAKYVAARRTCEQRADQYRAARKAAKTQETA